MTKESNIYVDLWRKYKPAIVSLMAKANEGSQRYPLSGHEFTAIGNRESAGYDFRLEVRNGVALNNIGGSAVARDLLVVLKESPTANKLWMENKYVFQNNKNFMLTISISHI
jgi:hypothetical protein